MSEVMPEKWGWNYGWLLDCRTVSYILCVDHRFTSFPEVLYQIVSLETVLLGNNQVNGVDPCRLIKLVRLSTLDLSNNDLLKIPPELGLCTSLRCVWSMLLSTSCSFHSLCHLYVLLHHSLVLKLMQKEIGCIWSAGNALTLSMC